MTSLIEFSHALAEVAASEGATPVHARPEDGGALSAIHLPTGGVIAWRAPDSADPNQSGNEVHKAAAAIRIATGAAARVMTIKRDDRLSESAKDVDIAAAWADAAAKADRLLSEVQAEAERFAAYEREFFAPAAVTDPVRQLADMEARQWLGRIPPADLPELVSRMHAGDHPELLQAAMRSPVPLPAGLAQVLPHAWRAHLERTRPDELRAIEARRERVDWLQMVATQVANVIPRPRITGPRIRQVA